MGKIGKRGSDVFETSNVSTDEYVLLAKTMVGNGSSIQVADIEIRAIDDMLGLLKMRPLINKMRYTSTGRMRKDASLSDLLGNRIEKLIVDLKEA